MLEKKKKAKHLFQHIIYVQWDAAGKATVQLRERSRGFNSAAVWRGLGRILFNETKTQSFELTHCLAENPGSQENQAAFYSACAFLFIHSLFVRCHLHEQSNSVSILFRQRFRAKFAFGTQQRYGCSVTQLLLKEA